MKNVLFLFPMFAFGPAGQAAPLILEVHAGQYEEGNTKISWVTDLPATGTVEHWLDAPADVPVPVAAGGLANRHAVKIDVPRGATFHFRVRARDAQGSETTSEVHTIASAGGWGPRLSSSDGAPWPGLRTSSVDEGESIRLPVFTSGGNVTIDIKGMAPWMSFDGNTFSADPGQGDRGIYQLVVTSTDAAGATDVEAIVINVKGPNDPPVVRNARVVRVTADSAEVRWTTDVLADSRVEYGPETTYGRSASRATRNFTHYQTVTGLTPDTLHHYRIVTEDARGRVSMGPDSVFTTNKSARQGRDWYVATHGSDSNPGTKDAPLLTIQHAADSTRPGDTVHIGAGTYDSFMLSNLYRDPEGNKKFNEGTMQAPITFRAHGAGEAIVRPGSGAAITIRERSYIVMDGLIVDGTGLNGSGVIIRGAYAGFNQVINCQVRHTRGQTAIGVLYGAHDTTLRGNRVYDNNRNNWPREDPENKDGSWGAAISASKGGARAIVEENVVYWNHGEGLSTKHAGSVIRKNIVADNWGTNVYVGGPNIIAEGNLVYNSPEAVAWPVEDWERTNPAGINVSVESVAGVPGATKASAVLRNNVIVNTFPPIRSYPYGSGVPYKDIVVVNNTLVHNASVISWKSSESNPLVGLRMHNNLIIQPKAGVSIHEKTGPPARNISFGNNLYAGSERFSWRSKGDFSGNFQQWRALLRTEMGADAAEKGSRAIALDDADDLIMDRAAIPTRLWTHPTLPTPAAIVFDANLIKRLSAPYHLKPGSPAIGPPYIGAFSYETVAAGTVIGVLANDTDSDGALDVTSVTVVTGPAHGAVVVNADGTLTYAPEAGFSGSDAFRYTVRDNEGATSNVATVRVTVAAANVAPVANDDGPIEIEGH